MAKASIHPNYQLATITCACGAIYETASTRGNFAVEICGRCHPFYTGRQKLVDSAGRIERFQRRYQLRPGAAAAENAKPAAEAKPEKAEKPAKPEAKPVAKAQDKPRAEAKPAKPEAGKPEAKPQKADKKSA